MPMFPYNVGLYQLPATMPADDKLRHGAVSARKMPTPETARARDVIGMPPPM